MTDEQLRVMKRFNDAMDDNLLYGRPMPRMQFSVPLPSSKEVREYPHNNLSARAKRAIDKLLATRSTNRLDTNEDILVDPFRFPWGPMHHEMIIRSRCFKIIAAADVEWIEEREIERSANKLPCEGWLLVENHHIIGAAEFDTNIDSSASQHWVWCWAFIDPEHRRNGFCLKRLPIWEQRYGSALVIDQPNSCAIAMLKKAGYFERFRVKGPPVAVDNSGGIANCILTLTQYEQL
jgi:hypothetical protein